jgi:hypothetical protein
VYGGIPPPCKSEELSRSIFGKVVQKYKLRRVLSPEYEMKNFLEICTNFQIKTLQRAREFAQGEFLREMNIHLTKSGLERKKSAGYS